MQRFSVLSCLPSLSDEFTYDPRDVFGEKERERKGTLTSAKIIDLDSMRSNY